MAEAAALARESSARSRVPEFAAVIETILPIAVTVVGLLSLLVLVWRQRRAVVLFLLAALVGFGVALATQRFTSGVGQFAFFVAVLVAGLGLSGAIGRTVVNVVSRERP